MTHRRPLTAVMLSVLPAFALAADESPESPADALRLDGPPAALMSVVPAANPFAKGTWTLEVEGSYTAPIRYSQADRATGSLGVGYYLWDDIAVTIAGKGFHADEENDVDVTGGEFSLMGRWHFLHLLDNRLSFYADGGGGLAWSDEAFPAGGTTYNFTARVGPGVTYRLTDTAHLAAGARYFHNSNGDRHGRDKNPGYDGVEYYVGVIFTFR
jgi:hypothetical protein